MPIKLEQHYYSAHRADCLSEIDKELDDIVANAVENSESADEIIAALIGDEPAERSKNASKSRSNNVSSRIRRSSANDSKTLGKMRSFVPAGATSDDSSLVGSALSSPIIPLTSPSKPLTTPANDNLIPVWELTGDLVKVVSATLALQIAEKPAVAFTFNMTPDALAKALRYAVGFLDCVKRSFDQELRRAGLSLPYWFAVDIDDDGRLHLHGAFSVPVSNLPALRQIRRLMKSAWGKWEGPGKRKQVRFKKLYSDDWATYCLKNQAAVRKVIGDRTMTISQPLRREAEWAYTECRRIMREGR